MTGTFSRRRKASAATVAGTLLAIVAFTAVNALSNGAFEYYDLFLMGYIGPGLVRSGLFTSGSVTGSKPTL